MRWYPISKMIRGVSRPPYLLQSQDRENVEEILKGRGFQVTSVEVGELRSERDASLAVARALDYPDSIGGSWDGFFDLLVTEFQSRPRSLAVSMLGADSLARRDLRLFVAVSWQLLSATETVESQGKGNWQLEFIYWGDWGNC